MLQIDIKKNVDRIVRYLTTLYNIDVIYGRMSWEAVPNGQVSKRSYTFKLKWVK